MLLASVYVYRLCTAALIPQRIDSTRISLLAQFSTYSESLISFHCHQPITSVLNFDGQSVPIAKLHKVNTLLNGRLMMTFQIVQCKG